MTVSKDTKGIAIKISQLDEQIRAFDCVLDRIQILLSDDIAVYDYVVQARDAIFRLQQAIRGCEVIDSPPATSGLDDMYNGYQTTLNDLFWNQEKQTAYDNEHDEGMEEDF